VDIEVDAATKAHRKGLIIATEPQINQTSRNLKVRAILQNGNGHPGAFVKVYVDAGADKRAVMVPTNCIIPEDKNNQLILVKDGRAHFVNVQTGVREANDVEIVKGVNSGDTVVVTGVLFARPNARLQVRGIKNLENMTNANNQ
jgi:membrane fusion protein (multidrug efflux system)